MSDLISREAVIDAIEQYDFVYPKYMERFVIELRDAIKADLKDDIEKLPSAQPEQRWVPCSERLPEYGESVLCYYGEDEDFGVNHIIDDEDGEWFIDGATAWMPLPEPYREENRWMI